MCGVVEEEEEEEAEAKQWCRRLLTALEGVRGGALNPLGEEEQRELGREMATTYLSSSSSSLEVRVKMTSKERTRQSCHAFWEGVEEVVGGGEGGERRIETDSQAWCDGVDKEDEYLLRPYATCPHVQHNRKAVLAGLYDDR